MHDVRYANHQSMAGIISDIRTELKEFVHTRVQLAAMELTEVAAAISGVALAAAAGIFFVLTACFWMVFAVTALIAAIFGDAWYRWPAAFAIVAVLLFAAATLTWSIVKNTLDAKTLVPRKTIEILKADAKEWSHAPRQVYE